MPIPIIDLRRDDLLTIEAVREQYIPAGYPYILRLLHTGQLKGKRIAGKWVTCREWILEYLNTPDMARCRIEREDKEAIP